MKRRVPTTILGLVFLVTLLWAAACSKSTTGPERIPVVQLEREADTIVVGDTLRVRLFLMLPPAYVPPVVWSSSNSMVARVVPWGDISAAVIGEKPGQAVIHVIGVVQGGDTRSAQDSLGLTVIARPP